jgi:tRNA nucleotidyltransferase (CCA-adding enzyme)
MVETQENIDKRDNNTKKEELSVRAKENLKRNEELRRKASQFLSLQPGEKFLGLFNPEKMEPVEREFDEKKVQRFQYTIEDPNTGQEKYWSVSKRTSEQIDAFLSEGQNMLKIQRLGSGKGTRYNILPV